MNKQNDHRSKPSFLIGFLKVSRVQNLIIIGITQYFTAIFLVRPDNNLLMVIQDINLFLIVFSTGLIAAAGYMINDYYDIKIDFVNKPEKVVVGTVLNRRTIIVSHTVLNLIGIILGLIVGLRIAIMNFLAAVMLWFYSNQLKRMPFIGNFTIGILTGLSVIVIAVYYQIYEFVIWVYAIFAFLVTIAREIIKDMEDLKGDKKFGSKTLPIIWGLRKTKNFIYFLSLIFISFLLYLIYFEKFPEVNFILIVFIIPILILNFLLYRADTNKHFYNLSQYTKWFMILGIISMIFII